MADIKGFPNRIEVILGDSWNGINGLSPDTVIMLNRVTGQDIWTEDGTLVPSETNRIQFKPWYNSDWCYLTLSAYNASAFNLLVNGTWGPFIYVYDPNGDGYYNCKEIFDNITSGYLWYGNSLFFTTPYPLYNPNIFKSLTPIIPKLELTILCDNPYEIREGDEFIDPGAKAFDEDDGNITDLINPPPPTFHTISNTNERKQHILEYSVTNSFGNTVVKQRVVNIRKRKYNNIIDQKSTIQIFSEDFENPQFLDAKTVDYIYPITSRNLSTDIKDTLNYRNCYRSLSIDVANIPKLAKYSFILHGSTNQKTGSIRVYAYREDKNYRNKDNPPFRYLLREEWAYIELMPYEIQAQNTVNTKVFHLNIDDIWDHFAVAVFGQAKGISIYASDVNDAFQVKIGPPLESACRL